MIVRQNCNQNLLTVWKTTIITTKKISICFMSFSVWFNSWVIFPSVFISVVSCVAKYAVRCSLSKSKTRIIKDRHLNYLTLMKTTPILCCSAYRATAYRHWKQQPHTSFIITYIKEWKLKCFNCTCSAICWKSSEDRYTTKYPFIISVLHLV